MWINQSRWDEIARTEGLLRARRPLSHLDAPVRRVARQKNVVAGLHPPREPHEQPTVHRQRARHRPGDQPLLLLCVSQTLWLQKKKKMQDGREGGGEMK